jgi:predicted amidohydrolase
VENTIDYIRNIMDENSLELVILNNIREERDNLYDTTFVIKKNNNYNEEYYDKIFLTPIEKKYFKTGSDQRVIINSKWGKLGITICYDLCFTGLAEKYAYEDNVDAIINSAAWRRDSVREYSLLNYRIDNYYEYIWDLKHAALASHNQV